MTSDSELLRHFARTHSEDAFAELVRRHLNLVYSAALRQVGGDAHLAKDVAQSVFTDLARKAGSLARRQNLSGWLYTGAHFAAAKMTRTETRRRSREEAFMREPITESAPDTEWENLRSMLDEVMHELKETDRDAILLRYFENRPFAEVGTKLGLNENAARMRVERAVEKLRAIFAKRGVVTTSALVAAISANAVELAPINLATTLTASALGASAAGTFTFMKLITLPHLKIGIAALVVASGTAAMVTQHRNQEVLRAENTTLQQQMAQLQTDNQDLSNHLVSAGEARKLPTEQFNELLKLRGEVGLLRKQVTDIGKLRRENSEMHQQLAETAQKLNSIVNSEQASFDHKRIQAVNDAKQIGLAMRLWAGENNDQYPTNFESMTNELGGIVVAKHFMENFELMNVGMINEQYPQMLAFREITPRQTPDGKWERVYGYVDGSVWTQTANDGDFGAWETKQAQYNPPVNH